MAGHPVHLETRDLIAVVEGVIDDERRRGEAVLDLREEARDEVALAAGEPRPRSALGEHLGVGAVRVDRHAEAALEERGVARVIGVPVREEHAGEVARPEAGAVKLEEERQALGRVARVDEPPVARSAVEDEDVRDAQEAQVTDGSDDGTHGVA